MWRSSFQPVSQGATVDFQYDRFTSIIACFPFYCLSEVESRTQAARPRPRAQKKSEAKDSLSEDRHSRGQGPRTQSASALQKKKVFTKIFQAISTKKNVFQKIFQALHKILTFQKIVLSSSRGQAKFRGLEASRPRT